RIGCRDMRHSSLAPVFTGLRVGLHALLLGLAAFAVVRAFVTSSSTAWWTLLAALAFVAVYLLGAARARSASGAHASGAHASTGAHARTLPAPRPGDRPARRPVAALWWIAALTALWAGLTWL